MNEKEYRTFYDRVGQSNGWDFSKLQCRVEGIPANLYKEVKFMRHSGVTNVRFIQMDAERLDFPERFFDVVSCRHSGFSAHKVAKVLSLGGGQSYGESDGGLMKKYIQDLAEAGFKEIQSFEYDSVEYYKTPEDLI